MKETHGTECEVETHIQTTNLGSIVRQKTMNEQILIKLLLMENLKFLLTLNELLKIITGNLKVITDHLELSLVFKAT